MPSLRALPGSVGRLQPRHATITPTAIVLCGLLVVLACAPITALAGYPDRPIRIVVPFAPGGGTDIVTRKLGESLASGLGQAVIIENKPGAGTIIGTNAVATSAPDGYALLMATFAHAVNPSLNTKLPYDTFRAFDPVALVARSFNIVVVNPKTPIKSIRDLVNDAKSNPGKINFGSYGIGTSAHLAGELFKSLASVDLTHVPYKGAAPAITERPNSGHVHDGRQRGRLCAERPVARARGDVSCAVSSLSGFADRRRERRSRLRCGKLVWSLCAGWHADGHDRAPEHIGGTRRSNAGLQKA
jgi:hypothetical protein